MWHCLPHLNIQISIVSQVTGHQLWLTGCNLNNALSGHFTNHAVSQVWPYLRSIYNGYGNFGISIIQEDHGKYHYPNMSLTWIDNVRNCNCSDMYVPECLNMQYNVCWLLYCALYNRAPVPLKFNYWIGIISIRCLMAARDHCKVVLYDDRETIANNIQ